jgi:hypothetical protein
MSRTRSMTMMNMNMSMSMMMMMMTVLAVLFLSMTAHAFHLPGISPKDYVVRDFLSLILCVHNSLKYYYILYLLFY